MPMTPAEQEQARERLAELEELYYSGATEVRYRDRDIKIDVDRLPHRIDELRRQLGMQPLRRRKARTFTTTTRKGV